MRLNRLLITAAALLLALTLVSCGDGSTSDTDGTSDADTDAKTDTTEAIPAVADTDEVTTDSPETERETESDTETDLPETGPDTAMPEFINPLTGLGADEDIADKRPVAIMINNIKKATPQHGIGDADVLYECLAEGGITRLLMISLEYEKLGVIGSVRSSRDYYLDFAADYDAIYVHAGGSPMAYEAIDDRDIDNLDGVKSNPADMFYRDKWRRDNMGYEHSLMTTGEGIKNAVARKKYRVTLAEGHVYPLSFPEYGTKLTLDGDAATNVTLQYHKNQVVDLTYDAETGKYLRFQFGGKPHIDENTGAQLAFDNVIIVLTDLRTIKGDEAGRLDVDTVGEGDGYYITGGKCVPIKWSKADSVSAIVYTNADGSPLTVNRGKTFVSIFDKDYKYSIGE